MVNNARIKQETPPPAPFPSGAARKIDGPIYDLKIVQQHVVGEIIYPVTDNADEDLEKLEWSTDDVALLIKALLPVDYKDSEWCLARNNLKIDADVYVVPYDHIDEKRNRSSADYYVKFGLLKNQLILTLISCHLPRMNG